MRWDPAPLDIKPVFPGLEELLLLLLCCCFIAFAQEVLNAEIFLLGELQLVAKDQEDAFTLHVSDFSEYSHCPQQDCFLYHSNIQFITKCVHPSTEALANAPQTPTTTGTTSTFFSHQSLFGSLLKFWYFLMFSTYFPCILQYKISKRELVTFPWSN